jgi:uncharacterized protein (DUF362 family)
MFARDVLFVAWYTLYCFASFAFDAAEDGVQKRSDDVESVKVWVWREAELEEQGWLPLSSQKRSKVTLKPNWVRHFNEQDRGQPERLVETLTSCDVLAAIASEARHVTSDKVIVADAPQFDTDWNKLWERHGLEKLAATLNELAPELAPEIRDLRQEAVVTDENDVILSRTMQMADPEGYQIVNVGPFSAFRASGFDFQRIRGADYDATETISHHSGGVHEYCVSGTILHSDLVINVPKVKTHKKSGVTLCLKNLVGINGNKNYLPHHRAGRPEDGGDEFPGGSGNVYRRLRAWAIDHARPLMNNPLVLPMIRRLRAVDVKTRPDTLIRNGNWWGNDTIWRMILDLNRVLLYADREGQMQTTPQRETFHVMDGIVAGDGEGPMAVDRKEMGLVIGSHDAVAADIVASALMGFDPLKIPVIREALVPHPLPITGLGRRAEGLEIMMDGKRFSHWSELPNFHFRAHSGWKGTIERDALPKAKVA